MAKMGIVDENKEEENKFASEPLYKKHEQLVKELNLDKETFTLAWESYQSICTNFTLEGDDLHWLGCAVFVACRRTSTPTVSANFIRGNPISLTSLLRICNLSLAHFFDKIKKWAEMANLHDDREFMEKIRKLEETFIVACNIYKQYYPLFVKIFKEPDMEVVRHRNRKQKPPPCTPFKVFEFIWMLYVTVKGKLMTCGDEVVKCYQILLVCLDLAFKNALMADQRDLLNPKFEGLPVDWNLSGYQAPKEPPCIVDKLLGPKINMLADASFIMVYRLNKYLKEMLQDGTLQGDADTLTKLFEPENFETNFVAVTKMYEQHILNDGCFDEKIFLAESQRQCLVKNASNGNVNVDRISSLGETDFPHVNSGNTEINQVPDTPLTGRRYLGPREQNETLFSTVTQSISRLQSLLSGCGPEPSENLVHIFESCANNPTDIIKAVHERMGKKFLDHYSERSDNVEEVVVNQSQLEQDEKMLKLGITLFYKLLENILTTEKNINKDISALLEKDIFHECLFPCVLEIIIYSYNSPRKFPWIMDALEVPASYFVRVIELIVRSRDQLSRDIVKHLSYIEETILESLMWNSNSILWDDISKWWDEIPKYEDIALPGNMVYNNSTGAVMHPNSRRAPFSPGNMQSPGPSAVETFQSPINPQVKKQLFPMKTGQTTVLQNNRGAALTHLIVTDQEGNKKLIPLEQPAPIITTPTAASSPIPPPPLGGTPPTEIRPKRTGSLCIIFRKFYNLAGVRMEHLCTQLGKTDVDLKRKIFTVFEHSIRKNTELLKDRHMDQLVMCAVYIICKITHNCGDNFFSDIMKCYRHQPQARSEIYRDVLMKPAAAANDGGEEMPAPHRSSLIDFYNQIYVHHMKNYIVRFSSSQGQTDNLLLSPLPSGKTQLISPKQQIAKNVFIKPYESPSAGNLNGNSYSYYFSRSASKDLKDINKAINGGVSGKRLLSSSDCYERDSKRFANRKMQALIEERKMQNVE